MFDVQPNVPLPPKRRHSTARKWPFAIMQIGDSFIVPDPERWKYAQATASVYGKRLKRKFTTRQMDDGLRVWRIK